MPFLTRKLIFALLLATASAGHGQDCSTYNYVTTVPGRFQSDNQHTPRGHSIQRRSEGSPTPAFTVIRAMGIYVPSSVTRTCRASVWTSGIN